MALPASWVDAIHERLTVRYGEVFSRTYHGANPEAVRVDWAETLDGISPERIRYALANLPDRVPHAGQFRSLCMQAPVASQQALPAPLPDPEFVGELMGRLNAAKAAAKTTPAQDCYANILRIVEGRGGKWSAPQRHMVQSMHAAGLIDASGLSFIATGLAA
jgi:hypothetical protein